MSKQRALLKAASLSLAMSLLSACTLLPEPEKVRIYHLESPTLTAEQVSRATPASVQPYVLEVRQPQASSAIDSARLAVYRSGLGQAYWQNVRFADRVPRLVQRQLTDALRSQQIFLGVVQEQQGLAADWVLLSDLQDFSVRLNNSEGADSPSVQVRLHVDVMDARQRELLAGKTFSAQLSLEPSGSTEAEHAVRALSNALMQIHQDIAQWLLELPATAAPR